MGSRVGATLLQREEETGGKLLTKAAAAERLCLKGGAPGISGHLGREGPWTLIILSNLDRGIVGPVEQQLEEWVAGLGQ